MACILGSKELCAGCGSSRSLQRLYLQHNGVGDDGAKALADALKTNSTLTYVDIGIVSDTVMSNVPLMSPECFVGERLSVRYA